MQENETKLERKIKFSPWRRTRCITTQENETKLEMKIKLSPWRRTSRWEARRQSSSYSWDIACKPSSARIALCVIFKFNLQKPFWNLNLLLTVGCFGFGGAPIPCLSLHIGHGLSQDFMKISIFLPSILRLSSGCFVWIPIPISIHLFVDIVQKFLNLRHLISL